MTVHELIIELNKCNQVAEVVIEDETGTELTVVDVQNYVGNNVYLAVQAPPPEGNR